MYNNIKYARYKLNGGISDLKGLANTMRACALRDVKKYQHFTNYIETLDRVTNLLSQLSEDVSVLQCKMAPDWGQKPPKQKTVGKNCKVT